MNVGETKENHSRKDDWMQGFGTKTYVLKKRIHESRNLKRIRENSGEATHLNWHCETDQGTCDTDQYPVTANNEDRGENAWRRAGDILGNNNSSTKPSSTLTSCLVSTGFSLNLSSRVGSPLLSCLSSLSVQWHPSPIPLGSRHPSPSQTQSTC